MPCRGIRPGLGSFIADRVAKLIGLCIQKLISGFFNSSTHQISKALMNLFLIMWMTLLSFCGTFFDTGSGLLSWLNGLFPNCHLTIARPPPQICEKYHTLSKCQIKDLTIPIDFNLMILWTQYLCLKKLAMNRDKTSMH